MPALRLCSFTQILAIGVLTLTAQAQDLHFKQDISVGGNIVSSSDVSVKGPRQRIVTASPSGNTVIIQQCDLKRSITLNEQSQAYVVSEDAKDEAALKAAALLGGGDQSPATPATITQTSTVIDTGERKPMMGYSARHLKMSVSVESAANACSQVSQKYEIDGWYADLNREQTSCVYLPPIRQTNGCHDQVTSKRSGTGKPGYPLTQTIVLHNADSTTTKITTSVSQITKSPLDATLFDVPAGYRQVNSLAELVGAPQMPQQAAAPNPQPQQGANNFPQQPGQFSPGNVAAGAAQSTVMSKLGQFGGAAGGATGIMSQLSGGGMQGMNGMNINAGANGMPAPNAVPLPQAVGPKAPGKIRIGIAPAQAQLGQGNDAQNDYGTPVRNSIIYLMSGPSIEIAALDSRLPVQVQAEAQQKQCDYILMSGVTIKHSSGGFGKFMKAGNIAASMTPIGMMAHTAGSLAAAQAAATVAQQAANQISIQAAQQAATSQLAGLNGQIKQKDDVTVEYHLYPTGQDKSVLDNVLKGKAKSDGEDVLTPLMQQAANSVLTQVATKK
jgi:hypothetical protein